MTNPVDESDEIDEIESVESADDVVDTTDTVLAGDEEIPGDDESKPVRKKILALEARHKIEDYEIEKQMREALDYLDEKKPKKLNLLERHKVSGHSSQKQLKAQQEKPSPFSDPVKPVTKKEIQTSLSSALVKNKTSIKVGSPVKAVLPAKTGQQKFTKPQAKKAPENNHKDKNKDKKLKVKTKPSPTVRAPAKKTVAKHLPKKSLQKPVSQKAKITKKVNKTKTK